MFGLAGDNIVGVGVDRLDYTKGIPERLEAIDRVLTRRPDLRGRFTFVQIGVPSRSELESYGAIESEIDRKVAEVNAKHGVPGGRSPSTITRRRSVWPSSSRLYRMAHFCVVSSLADGMNLVAKEFVAARDDEDGVLVLSALAGAAEELREALIINPYDVDGFASGAHARDRHGSGRAAAADASDAAYRRRPQRLQLGVGHPRGAGEPLDQAASIRGARSRRRAGLNTVWFERSWSSWVRVGWWVREFVKLAVPKRCAPWREDGSA